ncbi:MAG: glycogen/starch synthase, partial [Elusimicrobiota bacterium]|nr:glycogen/starch synthase [Elusimicrobiota bacterium]
ALDGFFAGARASAGDAAAPAAPADQSLEARVARWLGPVPPGDPSSPLVRRRVAELKHVLGDAGLRGKTMAWPVTFGKGEHARKARGPGLEGFLYSKLEHEKAHPHAVPLIGDYFRQVHTLLSAAPWAADLLDHVDAVGRSHLGVAEKNRRLNELLLAGVGVMRAQLRELDPSLAGRRNATYTILARAYNREKPGKDFFASFDAREFARIKKTGANEIWLMDVFEIGEDNRWGTGGGSAYSLKGYRVKPELGGDAGLKAFTRRAHAAGLKVKLDFVPNHTSLDSDLLMSSPESFLHLVPPQRLTDEQIMSQVPLERPGGAPVYRLVRLPDGRRILVHHPRTGVGEAGSVTWVDMAQLDHTRPQARAALVAELTRLFREFGVDSVRRDMAYELLSGRFHDRWTRILKKEIAQTPEGWMKQRSQKLLDGFSRRWKALDHAELLAELTAAAKAVDPAAVLIDEAHGSVAELSRAGSDGAYNTEHDPALGKIGLYDALRDGDPARVRAALRHAFFRRWQLGGAAVVNYVGTHEEFEGNPVDAFGPRFEAAALTALLLRPVLLFNGVEQGVGQARNVKGDLSKSRDTGKALPFDVPVKLDWSQSDPGRAAFLRKVLGAADKHQDLLDRGAFDLLDAGEGSPIVAWSVAAADARVKLVLAVNHSGREARADLRFDPLLPEGFAPKAGRRYLFKDALSGTTRRYTGRQLLEGGLDLALEPGGTRLFEVTESGAADLEPSGGAAAAEAPAEAPRPLSVFIAAGESVPFVKTGGLADVIDALGRGLVAAGQKTTVVLPKYAELKLPGVELERVPGAFAVPVNGRVETARLWRAVHEGVTFLFVEHDYYFARDGAYYGRNVDYTDNDERFVFFSRAVIEAARFLDERPDVLHAHDWQAALVAPMLAALKSADPFFARTRSVLTIHNMAYQGRFARPTLKKAGLDGRRFPSRVRRWGFNVMDAALRTADAVTTVSNTYKEEIQTPRFGEELDELLRARAHDGDLHGIVNGLDPVLYDPATDPSIAAHYGVEDAAEGKAANKLALQRALGLPEDASIPVFAIGSRFVRQKGLDLVGSVVPELARRGAQLVIVGAGNGEEAIERELAELARLYPETLKLHAFSETFVRLAYAGSDFLLMPSRFEPCGLSQLIAQRYGSLPLVTRTGGLADTVTDWREDPARGDGLFIAEFSPRALEDAVLAALALHSDQAALARARRTAMQKDTTWGPAIEAYLSLYRSLGARR